MKQLLEQYDFFFNGMCGGCASRGEKRESWIHRNIKGIEIKIKPDETYFTAYERNQATGYGTSKESMEVILKAMTQQPA